MKKSHTAVITEKENKLFYININILVNSHQ